LKWIVRLDIGRAFVEALEETQAELLATSPYLTNQLNREIRARLRHRRRAIAAGIVSFP